MDAAVLSSYDCSPFEYRKNQSIWYENSKNFFKSAYDDKCKKLFDFRKDYKKTHNYILDLVLDKPQIAIHYDYELTEYFNSIDTIYLLGLTLDNCIRTRPLGWENISGLSKIKTKQSCVVSGYPKGGDYIYHETAVMNNKWKCIHNDIYELIL